MPFLRFCAHTQTYTAPTILTTLLPFACFLPPEATLFSTDRLAVFLAEPPSYFGMLLPTFPLHCLSLCVAYVFCLSCSKAQPKPEIIPPSRIFAKPKHCSREINPCHAMGFVHRVCLKFIMVWVSFQEQTLISGQNERL